MGYFQVLIDEIYLMPFILINKWMFLNQAMSMKICNCDMVNVLVPLSSTHSKSRECLMHTLLE